MPHEQETCFLYKPGNPKAALHDGFIRERLARANSHAVDKRLHRFLEAREILDREHATLVSTHLQTMLSELAEFVNHPTENRLPTVVLTKADVKAYAHHIRASQPDWHCISIHSKECPNLKSALKLIVNRFTEAESHLVLDRRLTYDLHVLIDWLKSTQKFGKLLIVVEDTEGFDAEILRELIAHLHTYVGLLDLHLVLNLTVPLALIEDWLSQENIASMQVKVIQGLPPTTDYLAVVKQAFAAMQLPLSEGLLEKVFELDIGPAHSSLLYAVVAHFAGNPLAGVTTIEELREYPEAHRLPSVHAQGGYEYLAQLENLGSVLELQVGGAVLDVVFNPHYRPLLEQALSDPRVFGGRDLRCVPTSVLYQLSRESSIYINIHDLYCAFRETVPAIGEQWDKQSMAFFLQSITALKLIGVLRDCKRKFECVEKVSWNGV